MRRKRGAQARRRHTRRLAAGGVLTMMAVVAGVVLPGTMTAVGSGAEQATPAALPAGAVRPEKADVTQEEVLSRCRRRPGRCWVVIGGNVTRSSSSERRVLTGSGKQRGDYHWYYDRDEPYAICDGDDCYYRGTLHIHYRQSLDGYQMRYWHSIDSDYEIRDPFRILANHVGCRRDRPRDSDCDESPNPPPVREWRRHLRQPDRGVMRARDGSDGKKFLNLRHDFELDIGGLPTVDVTGTDTSYRWVCDDGRVDKCRYDGPD